MRRQHFNEVLKGWEFLISLKGNLSDRVVISHKTNFGQFSRNVVRNILSNLWAGMCLIGGNWSHDCI